MAKAKISVTIDRSLLRDCDRLARGTSRSEAVEEALARWVRERRRRSLEDEIERYYASLSAAEGREDRKWASFAARALGETWK